MAKLTKDQKRKKKLADKAKQKNIAKVTKSKPSINMEAQILKYIATDEAGNRTEKSYEVKVERAKLLYCEERMCNGKIAQIKPDKNIEIVAWDYFGVAGCNFIHPGIEECDGLRTFITPNEVEGLVVAFPDWKKDEFFDTSSFLIFTEPDTKFDFANDETVQQIEGYVHEDVLPVIANHPHVESIDPKFVFRSYSLFKAFGKHWCASLFVSKNKVKKLEREINKKNLERDFLNKSSVNDVITAH